MRARRVRSSEDPAPMLMLTEWLSYAAMAFRGLRYAEASAIPNVTWQSVRCEPFHGSCGRFYN